VHLVEPPGPQPASRLRQTSTGRTTSTPCSPDLRRGRASTWARFSSPPVSPAGRHHAPIPVQPTRNGGETNFTAYTPGGFGKHDQQALAAVFRQLDQRGVLVMLSNSETPLVRQLYAGFRIDVVSANRSINSKATKRGAIAELVVRNY